MLARNRHHKPRLDSEDCCLRFAFLSVVLTLLLLTSDQSLPEQRTPPTEAYIFATYDHVDSEGSSS